MCLERFQARDLLLGEIRTDKRARMLPVRAVRSEDPAAEQRAEDMHALAEAEGLEVCGEHGFEVFRLDSYGEGAPENGGGVGVAD